MSLTVDDLKAYKSSVINDGISNGGRMSAIEIVSAAASNYFDGVSNAERLAGSSKMRKVFLKVHSDSDETLSNPKIFWDNYTPADDVLTFFIDAANPQTNVQDDVNPASRKYGCGSLNTNVSAAAGTLIVDVEDGSDPIFVDGDTIRISDKATLAGVGTEELLVIDTVSYLGDVATITLDDATVNGYLASNTRIMSVYKPSNVKVTFTNKVVTTVGSGDYNFTYLTGNNKGSIEQTWTLTFSNATNFGIVGDTVGSVGTGTTGAGASPNNTDFTESYFDLSPTGFSGTYQSGDTIVFTSHPASVPVWVLRVVPASAGVLGNNSAVLVLRGETA